MNFHLVQHAASVLGSCFEHAGCVLYEYPADKPRIIVARVPRGNRQVAVGREVRGGI
jgi:hypothetical protein